MIQIGDRFMLKPAHIPREFNGRTTAVVLFPGSVIRIYQRFALILFDGGWLECFPLFGPESLDGSPRAKYVKQLR